jgi:diacylglycerol kinase
MKNDNFIQSVICAAKGLLAAIKKEKNFIIYFAHIAITILINIAICLSPWQWAIYILCIIGVFSSECINTAIETLCNYISCEYDERIKYIKDVAAGAVLCWGIAFYAFELIMIGVSVFA